MRFAIVENERTPPAKGLSGLCPACGSPVHAKCGRVRVHHWAHTATERNCDPWWEHETPWHREWKSHFPAECQEVIHYAQDGEKHIADVKTAQGLTIEFQHSSLRPEERESREAFYGRMVWVVDGSRSSHGRRRFDECRSTFRRVIDGIVTTGAAEHMFPPHWRDCATPIFFDFHDSSETQMRTGPLYCLLPGRVWGQAVVVVMARETFIARANRQAEIVAVAETLRLVENFFVKLRELEMQELERLIALGRHQVRLQQYRALAALSTRSRARPRGRSRY